MSFNTDLSYFVVFSPLKLSLSLSLSLDMFSEEVVDKDSINMYPFHQNIKRLPSYSLPFSSFVGWVVR